MLSRCVSRGFVGIVMCVTLLAAIPGAAMAEDYIVHVGGVCSQEWDIAMTDTKGAAISYNAEIDQRNSMGTAVGETKALLDNCTGDVWCYVLAYSNGASVVEKALALYGQNWNIGWVFNVAGNAGGSPLADSNAAFMADLFGFSCNLIDDVGESDMRNGWNHNVTHGVTIYHDGGSKEFCETGGDDRNCNGFGWPTWVWPAGDYFEDNANDGVVPVNSSAGLNQDVEDLSVPDGWSPNFCHSSSKHWVNHVIAFSCTGHDKDHFEMKSHGISLLNSIF